MGDSSVPTSMLSKEHNAVCYNEAQAARINKVGWVHSEHNLADLFTKTPLSNENRRRLVETIFNNDATSFAKT